MAEGAGGRDRARFAAIDVGSNAIRLRIVEAHAPEKNGSQLLLPVEGKNGDWREIANLRAAVRLGTEVFLSGKLAPSSIGQACSYKIGHIAWMRARAESQKTLGSKFDIKQFHEVLHEGAMPLSILERRIRERTAQFERG